MGQRVWEVKEERGGSQVTVTDTFEVVAQRVSSGRFWCFSIPPSPQCLKGCMIDASYSLYI